MRSPRLSAVIAVALTASPLASASKSVNVGMKAAFQAGPYLLELLETAAGENSSAYFPLLDRIASGYFASASSDSDLYEKFLNVLRDDGHVSSPEALSTLNLALSLRTAAPRIEAHYQYYDTAVEPAVTDSKCPDWILLDGKQYCTPAMEDVMKHDLYNSEVKELPFDRTLGAGREAVLYTDPASPTFSKFHVALSRAARTMALSYRVRYRRSSVLDARPLPVSGYGVELALKKTDYIVIDDRESHHEFEKPLGSDAVLNEIEEVADLQPLSASELGPLGIKTASFIQRSTEPFATLVKVTQDFPRYAASLASHNVSQEFLAEAEENRAKLVRGGINFLWMNGRQLIERQIEPFNLVEMLRRERMLIRGVRSLGLDGKQAVSLLGHEAVSSAKEDDESLRYDWTDREEHGHVIIWLNDLENDVQYAEYPKELASLLRRTYPGQMPPIGLNIFNLIIPADISNEDDIQFLLQVISIMSRGIPIRFGLVPSTSTPEASAHAKLLYYLIQNYGAESVAGYLQALGGRRTPIADERVLSAALASQELLPDGLEMSLHDILAADSFAMRAGSAASWAKRLRTDTSTPLLFINGILTPRDKKWMQTVSMKIGEDLQSIQQGIFHGSVSEDTWVPGIFLKGAATRRNPYISPEDDKSLRILDVSKIYEEHGELLGQVPILGAYTDSSKENWAVVTVIADVMSDGGQDLVLAALEFKRNNPGIHLEFLHNPDDMSTASRVNFLLKTNIEKLATIETREMLDKIINKAADGTGYENYPAALSNFLSTARLGAGTQSILLNGRIVGPIAPEDTFTSNDFHHLLEFEQQRRILPVYNAVDDLGLSDRLSSAVAAAKLTSITALSTISDLPEGIFESAPTIRSILYDSWNTTHTAIEVGDPRSADIHIVGLLDPVSEKAQRWVPILKVLSDLEGVYVKLILNPRDKIGELPVKRFFRFVMEPKPSFDASGNVAGLRATFSNLPSEALLTAAMDVPPAWLVAPKDSAYDLDNIMMSSAQSDVDATYELQHILIEGHSRDNDGSPPRGAQLVLSTEREPLVTDTIVMSNLGFFQFKANPGFYKIQLKAGRTSDIYTIESIGAQGWEPVHGDEGTELALMDFRGSTLYPRLKRKPGMEEEDVLDSTKGSSSDSLVSKGMKFAEGLLGGSKNKDVTMQAQADINIFSVASGHLYERMLNIMMVSVMRNTKHSVKFWFIEQFLSPSFKEFIPHLAEEYGFKYEMVTYKWPHWLRQQKEKQREIWGYKILFLDVLFPLSLDKVIFVDADQVVRTDMMDLVNLDLEGAPYGFTPMCDSRTEMEGFRFWKQGYWANYLNGKPYHISALYVVDLRRFRELAAGDRLRQQYHALSADPASLSNLDQDLPNHMQFQIPIHSLPQEWLWCETWCSDDSLASARTIDLCNNPQTKEPKLDRARRQVPEWTVYDEEIAALDKRRKQNKATQPHAPDSSDGTEAVTAKSRTVEEEPESGHVKDEL
ncbi:killer toxin resistant protein [Purpureocillium takamizusanense]|uniref:Killer toxin resistant protein n=1 Tax=Purpureocillium takamizusanense TaxID=2060973 RepID=A0A9Q8V923_9HYPO|nr:killer toxin resistant protein [Purpureocillium takamizusanense]UNI17283.1 killer toxin resistant protein [Purpureocillium takamizusanense]